jgi:phosphomevalonate kinase
MAMANVKTHCTICNDEEDTFECKGCSQIFCYIHLTDHRENINKDFNQIEDDYNLFRETLNDQKNDPEKRSLVKEIDQWEKDSIMKIKQTAKECKQTLIDYINKDFINIENKLNKLTNEIKEIRKKNKFNEKNLNEIKQNLNKLKEELDKPSNVSIQQEYSSFINKIFVIVSLNEGNKI